MFETTQYASHGIPQSNLTPAIERDPREQGNLTAQLQVAEELVANLRNRVTRLASTIQDGNAEPYGEGRSVHMSLMQFPSNIIADARCIDSQLNRIEGALGV